MRKMTLLNGASPFLYTGNKIGCLLLHGLTGSPFEMRWLGQHLNSQDYTVYGPRLPGHGTNPRDLQRVSWREWYFCALDGYRLLRQRCEQVFVMGLSMGGGLTLLLAANEAIDGLAIFSTPYDLKTQIKRPMRALLPLVPSITWLIPTIPKDGAPERVGAFEQYVREEAQRRGEEFSGRGNYGAWVTAAVWEMNRLLREMRQGLSQITAPALLVYSKGDHTVTLPNSQYIYETLGSSRKELLILENSNHNVTIHTEHRLVFDAVSSFIEENL